MKPLFLTLTMAALLVVGVSTGCGKDHDASADSADCWTCTITMISRYAAFPENNSNVRSTQTVCDKTEAQIRDGEKQGTHTQTAGSGSNAVSIATTTSCSRQ